MKKIMQTLFILLATHNSIHDVYASSNIDSNSDTSWIIDAKQQFSRDSQRISILNKELIAEKEALLKIQQQIKNIKNAKEEHMNKEQIQQLLNNGLKHQGNIDALHKELGVKNVDSNINSNIPPSPFLNNVNNTTYKQFMNAGSSQETQGMNQIHNIPNASKMNFNQTTPVHFRAYPPVARVAKKTATQHKQTLYTGFNDRQYSSPLF
jgi:hypothetical protein